jgi:hypothetical protein
MKSFRIAFIILLHIPLALVAGGGKNAFRIYISDNHNLQYEERNYLITGDSLIITALSDNGKSNVNYLRRATTRDEKAKLQRFMKQFPVDKINELYFKDYANLGYISPDHYPRVIDMELENGGVKKKTRINNIFVPQFADLFKTVNEILPAEVKIKYEESQFK